MLDARENVLGVQIGNALQGGSHGRVVPSVSVTESTVDQAELISLPNTRPRPITCTLTYHHGMEEASRAHEW
jgi:hypothetical protein